MNKKLILNDPTLLIAKAFINGRGYVIPEDVKYVAKDILRHRILLSYEAEAEEISSEDIIDQLLQEIPVP